ncbi:MAG: HD domain-containing protein [Candidatus Bipolaricaulis sp.]|nr:HD domain-containing protein [Candidatus Bipolaricaulis sp.]
MIDPTSSSLLSSANYRFLWARGAPKHPLPKHRLDASTVFPALPQLANDGWCLRDAATLAELHDIGKASVSFQLRIPAFSNQFSEAGCSAITAEEPCLHEQFLAELIQDALARGGAAPALEETVARVKEQTLAR